MTIALMNEKVNMEEKKNKNNKKKKPAKAMVSLQLIRRRAIKSRLEADFIPRLWNEDIQHRT